MNRITLTPSQARKVILHAAGLSKRGQFGKGREAVSKRSTAEFAENRMKMGFGLFSEFLCGLCVLSGERV